MTGTAPEAAGAFVCVVGPSGGGKDTLLAAARPLLAGKPVLFPRRVVTRRASSFEDNDSVDVETFLADDAAGRFALSWQAHGLHYAIPGSVVPAMTAGAVAVCNVSRAVIPLARGRFARTRVVLITAPPGVIEARLAGRGRESPAAIRERIVREGRLGSIEPDRVIENVGEVRQHAGELAAYLFSLCPGTDAEHPIETEHVAR